jgi:hypothetical protein
VSDGRAPARAVGAFAARDLGRLAARIRVPGSKSLTNRHLVLAALADGESVLRGALRSDDCDRLCAALAAMGARFSWTSADTVRVEGVAGRPRGGVRVDLGDGGTPTRFMLAVAALAAEDSEIDGSTRMRERPVGEGVDLLVALGARAAFPLGGHALPVLIGGPLHGGAVDIGRTASSQFVSALLLVAPWMREGLDIRFTDEPTSASYLALSLGALAAHGVDAATSFAPSLLSAGAGAGLRSVAIAPTRVKGAEIDIEPDASSAVYPAALAALVGGEVVLEGLPRRSCRQSPWINGAGEGSGDGAGHQHMPILAPFHEQIAARHGNPGSPPGQPSAMRVHHGGTSARPTGQRQPRAPFPDHQAQMIRRHHLDKADIGAVRENRVMFQPWAYFADGQRIKIGHEKIRMGITH